MKIAFLTPQNPHLNTGVSRDIGTSMAAGLLAKGCTVRILVYCQKEEGVFNDERICVQQMQKEKLKGLLWYLTRKKLQRVINTLHQQKAIDVVEAGDRTGITSFRLDGSDTYFRHLDNRPVKWNIKIHEKLALNKADAFLLMSQFRDDFTNELFGLERKFTVIPNCIDKDSFNSNNNNNILYFGSFIRKKRLWGFPLIFNEVINK